MTDRDKIITGECVSPMTVDRCSYCVDTCEASNNSFKLIKVLIDNEIDKHDKTKKK
jgi:hypothetical protein